MTKETAGCYRCCDGEHFHCLPENSPDFIYFYTLYNIFNEFLDDISEDVLPNGATGFKKSKIWGMLYNFQKRKLLAIINKLEQYNGCILMTV